MATKNTELTNQQRFALTRVRRGGMFTVRKLADATDLTVQQARNHVNSLLRLRMVEVVREGSKVQAAIYRRLA